MPFALVFIGLVLVVTGARGTMRELGNELREDFTGPGNFIWWIFSIGTIGALGYIPEMRSFSRWFMALIIIAMVLSNRGFFAKLSAALASGPENLKPGPDTGTQQEAFLNNLPFGKDLFGGILGGAGGTGAQNAFKLALNSGDVTAPSVDGKSFNEQGISQGVGNAFATLFKRFEFVTSSGSTNIGE